MGQRSPRSWVNAGISRRISSSHENDAGGGEAHGCAYCGGSAVAGRAKATHEHDKRAIPRMNFELAVPGFQCVDFTMAELSMARTEDVDLF